MKTLQNLSKKGTTSTFQPPPNLKNMSFFSFNCLALAAVESTCARVSASSLLPIHHSWTIQKQWQNQKLKQKAKRWMMKAKRRRVSNEVVYCFISFSWSSWLPEEPINHQNSPVVIRTRKKTPRKPLGLALQWRLLPSLPSWEVALARGTFRKPRDRNILRSLVKVSAHANIEGLAPLFTWKFIIA